MLSLMSSPPQWKQAYAWFGTGLPALQYFAYCAGSLAMPAVEGGPKGEVAIAPLSESRATMAREAVLENMVEIKVESEDFFERWRVRISLTYLCREEGCDAVILGQRTDQLVVFMHREL